MDITTTNHHLFWIEDSTYGDGWAEKHLREMEADGWRVVSTSRERDAETLFVMTKEGIGQVDPVANAH